MKQIKIKLDIPDGLVLEKIEAEGDNIVAFVKEKGNFKRGGTLYHDTGNLKYVIIFSHIDHNDEKWGYCYFELGGRLSNRFGYLYRNCATKELRLATPSEAQQLFDALAKEGKKWNPETLQIEDIEKDIFVPECVGIYRLSDRATTSHDNGDGLYISFNEYKQVLFYSDGQYGVINLDNICLTSVQCKLTPCKCEDLKAGDTAFFSETFRLDDTMLSDSGRYVKILRNKAVKINESAEIIFDRQHHNHWYKVEPITK